MLVPWTAVNAVNARLGYGYDCGCRDGLQRKTAAPSAFPASPLLRTATASTVVQLNRHPIQPSPRRFYLALLLLEDPPYTSSRPWSMQGKHTTPFSTILDHALRSSFPVGLPSFAQWPIVPVGIVAIPGYRRTPADGLLWHPPTPMRGSRSRARLRQQLANETFSSSYAFSESLALALVHLITNPLFSGRCGYHSLPDFYRASCIGMAILGNETFSLVVRDGGCCPERGNTTGARWYSSSDGSYKASSYALTQFQSQIHSSVVVAAPPYHPLSSYLDYLSASIGSFTIRSFSFTNDAFPTVVHSFAPVPRVRVRVISVVRS
ncbi:hypothetical protein C8F01DRAFT_1371984 [Mycena amicta]|nr:hypothetical protein C8F01DRAFT_1371984 [Mycena amicta]